MTDLIQILILVSLYVGQAVFWYYAGYNKGSAMAIENIIDVVGGAIEHK